MIREISATNTSKVPDDLPYAVNDLSYERLRRLLVEYRIFNDKRKKNVGFPAQAVRNILRLR